MAGFGHEEVYFRFDFKFVFVLCFHFETRFNISFKKVF